MIWGVAVIVLLVGTAVLAIGILNAPNIAAWWYGRKRR